MQALLASVPIALVILAMAGLRWRAATAGLLGLACALILGVWIFDLGATFGPAVAVGGAMAEALFTTATILWIIFPALCIYEAQQRSGAFDVIGDALAGLSDDPRIQVLLVAWFFGLFMEGVAGFGTPVALAAPILVGLGFSPVRAVTLALIGHAAGVSFGAIGTPVVPLVTATGLSSVTLARDAAILHSLVGPALVIVLFVMAGGAGQGTHRGRWPDVRDLVWPILAAVCFFVPFLAIAVFVGPELPSVAGAIIGGTVFVLILRRRSGPPRGASVGGREIIVAALPYLVLLVLILVSRLVPQVQGVLRDVEIAWTFAGRFSGTFEPLYHPGTLLFAGFLIGAALQGQDRSDIWAAMGAAAGRLLPVVVALAAMLGLSRILVHAGMIDVLADAAAASGQLWPLIAPFIGVLGTFITGSATSSNILFAEFQQATAETLSLPVASLQGAQNFGAAIGNIISPHNIIAGAATVGLASGREGDVMRVTAVVCLVYAAAGSVVTTVLVAMG